MPDHSCLHACCCPFFCSAKNQPPAVSLVRAIDELLEAKRQANRRPKYVNSLRLYLNAFARGREQLPLDRIDVTELESWFKNRNESNSTRASNVFRLSALFSFGQRRGYVNQNPCKRLEPVTVDRKPPAILSVEQSRIMLDYARSHFPRFLPWLVLALFAGVRPDELERLNWQNVDLTARHVTIDAAASKIRRRRVTPLATVAVEWLRFGGDIPIPLISRRRYIRRLRNRLSLEDWPPDVLRHTAASMMLAREQDAGKVALWLGNSPKILLSHYQELVSQEATKQFWQLSPFTGFSDKKNAA
jgi:integrase/recombinase XerD